MRSVSASDLETRPAVLYDRRRVARSHVEFRRPRWSASGGVQRSSASRLPPARISTHVCERAILGRVQDAMLAVTATLPERPTSHPALVLIHGAANSAVVWTFWQTALAAAGWSSYALDLRGHGRSSACDLSQTRMQDYVADVRAVIAQLAAPPVVMGWSMGGLVALMTAVSGDVRACVGLAPSAPAARVDGGVTKRAGEFGPEEYGLVSADLDHQPAMPDLDREERRIALDSLGRESRLARDERQAGVVVPELPCPFLLVTGGVDTQWPRSRYAHLSLPADHVEAPEASHWGLVLNRRALADLVPTVLAWLERSITK
jgi:pimeloyl-ACP methyl ester carboxylesterase